MEVRSQDNKKLQLSNSINIPSEDAESFLRYDILPANHEWGDELEFDTKPPETCM